jgi:hypothetical protein
MNTDSELAIRVRLFVKNRNSVEKQAPKDINYRKSAQGRDALLNATDSSIVKKKCAIFNFPWKNHRLFGVYDPAATRRPSPILNVRREKFA